jgi:hypothetical protein
MLAPPVSKFVGNVVGLAVEYRKVSPAFGMEDDVILGCAIIDSEMQELKIMKIRFILKQM